MDFSALVLLSLHTHALQEQDRRRKAEVAAHSALNGPRVRAFEYAGPDFEVNNIVRDRV